MKNFTVAAALLIAERIEQGHRDYLTSEPRFEPLWQHHFLLESFIAMLRHHDTATADFHHANFCNVCDIMAPEFLSVLDALDLTVEATA